MLLKVYLQMHDSVFHFIANRRLKVGGQLLVLAGTDSSWLPNTESGLHRLDEGILSHPIINFDWTRNLEI